MYTLRKSLGQHFLKDENIARKIVDLMSKCRFTNLLEVGPGAGALTKYLLNIPGIHFKAVEIDEEKVDYLLSAYPQLNGRIIHKNFLDIGKPFEGRFAVIGNFPYNISTQILFKLLEWKSDVDCVVGMFQKEVGQRIAAPEGNKMYGITSVLTQAFFSVEYLFDVNERSFQPAPKVKSAVVRMIPVREQLAMKSEKDFFELVRTAFNQRRKTLRNATRALFDAATLREKIFDKRAEQLQVKDFAALSFKLQS
jgi:16S rRNA (adenine1518-N6/adenine1519-N6)-dimethyltransferase